VEALQCFALAAEYRDDDTTSTPSASATSPPHWCYAPLNLGMKRPVRAVHGGDGAAA
jgi:hypothetical protein